MKSEDKKTAYYRNTYFQEWGKDQEDGRRKTIYLDALRFLQKNVAKGSLFDIGAGNGLMLATARDLGWQVSGQEISRESCRVAQERYGLELISNDLNELDLKVDCFDAITMVNVLDHLHNPWRVLEKTFDALKPGGALYIRVPNGYLHNCFYRITGNIPMIKLRDRLRKFLVMHLYHFSPSFLKRALKDAGFGSVIITGSAVSEISFNPNSTKGEAFWMNVLKKVFPSLSNLIEKLTKGNLIVSPSINVYAFKNQYLNTSKYQG